MQEARRQPPHLAGLLFPPGHEAVANLAAEAAAGKETEPLDLNRVPRVTYTRPHVAAVGLTEYVFERGYTGRPPKVQAVYSGWH